MDEIILRRLRHLQWLEENHEKDFEERFGVHETRPEQKRRELADVLSADWNRKQKAPQLPTIRKPLPGGWRKEHWKTQQSMAADYTGVVAGNKKEAVHALEAYEAELTLPPAA
ncbi:MAG: hypothetical protein MI743_19770 [Sneathiellales bacterium]|nr:hypothetical protein [Sneathiellales bacterium]